MRNNTGTRIFGELFWLLYVVTRVCDVRVPPVSTTWVHLAMDRFLLASGPEVCPPLTLSDLWADIGTPGEQPSSSNKSGTWWVCDRTELNNGSRVMENTETHQRSPPPQIHGVLNAAAVDHPLDVQLMSLWLGLQLSGQLFCCREGVVLHPIPTRRFRSNGPATFPLNLRQRPIEVRWTFCSGTVTCHRPVFSQMFRHHDVRVGQQDVGLEHESRSDPAEHGGRE